MTQPISIGCNHAWRGPRHMKRANASLGVRLATLAIAALALLLMLYGQQWMLQRSPGLDELTVATCIVGAVADGPEPDQVCTSSVINDNREML